MFKFLFYFFAVFAIVYEIWNIKNFGKKKEIGKRIVEHKKIETNQMTTEQKNFVVKGCLFVLFHILYLLWAFLGLFTFQWPIFLFMFILGFIGTIKYLKDNETWNSIDGVISIFLLLFVVLNTYHFKIDVFQAILSFLLD